MFIQIHDHPLRHGRREQFLRFGEGLRIAQIDEDDVTARQ